MVGLFEPVCAPWSVGGVPADFSFGQITPDSIAAALLPAGTAVPHLPRCNLAAPDLDVAIRGGLIPLSPDLAASPAPHEAVAAFDETGELVGILRRHDSGAFRLKPNFRGLG